jgi:hypothetical protein
VIFSANSWTAWSAFQDCPIWLYSAWSYCGSYNCSCKMKTGSRITSVQIMLLLVVFFLCNAGGLQVESRSIPAKFTHQMKPSSSSTQKLQNFSGSLSSCSPPPISYSPSPYNYYSPPPSSPTYNHSPNSPVYSSPSPYYVSPVPHESPSSPTVNERGWVSEWVTVNSPSHLSEWVSEWVWM